MNSSMCEYDAAEVSASNIRAWIEAGLRSLGKIKDKDEVHCLGFAGITTVNGVKKYQDPKDAHLHLGDKIEENWLYQITWMKKPQMKGVELVKSGTQL